jgi:hypothetical protein
MNSATEVHDCQTLNTTNQQGTPISPFCHFVTQESASKLSKEKIEIPISTDTIDKIIIVRYQRTFIYYCELSNCESPLRTTA